MQKVIAIDFDGTLCENKYPEIGLPRWGVIFKALSEQEKAETSKAIADQKIAVLTQQLEKKKKHRTLGDRVLQMIGFWVGIVYWLENMDRP